MAVAGTKGKTTIVRALSHIYSQTNRPTLLVDTDGHYLNGEQKSTTEDSLDLYYLVPTTCPGRYLYELRDQENSIAILELSIESFLLGTGYRLHNIAILTNIFEDHIGLRVKNRRQLADEKAAYTFGRLGKDGVAIFNADDKRITSRLNVIPTHFPITLLPVGLTFKHFNLKQHLKKGGQAIAIIDGLIGLKSANNFKPILKAADIPWTFNGQYDPSLYNLMFIIGALWAEQGQKEISTSLLNSLKEYRLSETGGRLILLENKQRNLKVIVDYAHEKYSLRAVADLADKLASGKTIGVIRLAATKPTRSLQRIGRGIANEFDQLIIYDKIDGVKRIRFKNTRHNIIREVGDTARIVHQAIMKSRQTDTAQVVIREDHAIAKAFELAQPGDVIVHIANDDHAKSIDLVKQQLNAT